MLTSRAALITLFFATAFALFEAKRLIQPNQPINYDPACPDECIDRYRCNPYYSSQLIWAKVDGICQVFANECVYGSKECARQNDCLPPMVRSSKEECQLCCASGCDALPVSPVCGSIPNISTAATPGDMSMTFKNQCALDEWSCKNERPYSSSNPGSCS